MNPIPVISIFREALLHFKSNWIKLMRMSLIGYVLPILLFVGMSAAIFSEDMTDCAPCAMTAMFIELILLVVLCFVISYTKIMIRTFCHKSLANQYDGFGNLFVNSGGFRFLPLELLFYFCLGPWLFLLAMFSDFIEIQVIYILLSTPLLIIFIFLVFVSDALCSPNVKFWMSFRVSKNIIESNYGIVLKTIFLSFLICILLCCTGIGIIVALPFYILTKTILYRKLSNN